MKRELSLWKVRSNGASKMEILISSKLQQAKIKMLRKPSTNLQPKR